MFGTHRIWRLSIRGSLRPAGAAHRMGFLAFRRHSPLLRRAARPCSFRQYFLSRAANIPETFSKTFLKTLRRPAAKGQTLIYGESSLRAEDELCAELCAERQSGRLSALSRGTPTTLLPKSRDERLFALWHGLFASGAKGRWFESTRAYHILKDLAVDTKKASIQQVHRIHRITAG